MPRMTQKMNAIFITGTAGSGKSLLTSRLLQWYIDRRCFPISINLDPGVVNLPYRPDVDIRDFIDVNTLMETYNLGPNGSVIMASDMIATRIDEIQDEVNSLNPDYIFFDTPGQIELFAFRISGSYFVSHLQCDNKVNLFLCDGMLMSTPMNFVSIQLLASAVKLRLKIAQINILTKRDLLAEKLKEVLGWAASNISLESSLDKEKDSEYSLLTKDLSRTMNRSGLPQNLIAVSGSDLNGIANLSAALSRIVSQGEECIGGT
jgi:GTPase SAR1 family protein